LKLQKFDKATLPSETFRSNAFLTQFINKSNDSSKTSIERITISDEPVSDLANLIRKLQPSSTKNSRPSLTERSSFKILTQARSSSG